MKNILSFGASNSTSSINRKLAEWAAAQVEDGTVTTLDLNDFEMPIYSPEREKEGAPKEAQEFKKLLENADGIIISFAEYNGSYTSAFKNIIDWASRLEGKLWSNKPMLLLATSPGGRGGQLVLEAAQKTAPHMGGRVLGSFSLPSYHSNFSPEQGITDAELKLDFEKQFVRFVEGL